MKTILLVEDDSLLSRVCVKILEQAGYSVLAAKAGDEAVTLFARRSVDLVVVDMYLPGALDGYEVIDACRRIRPDVPILGISGGGGFTDSEGLLRGARDLGALVTLSKPFSESDLTGVVADIFKSAEGAPKERRGFLDLLRRPKHR